MSIAFLVGRHGAGKSSVGSSLKEAGISHISVGLLRRIARSGKYPADVPIKLMLGLRKTRSGEPMPEAVAKALISYAHSISPCVVDGFPTTASELALLDSAPIILIWSPKQLRTRRLEKRSESTQRKWEPGGKSQREENLGALLLAARTSVKVGIVRNVETIECAALRLHTILLESWSVSEPIHQHKSSGE